MSRFANAWDTLSNFVTGLGQYGIDPTQSTQYVLNLLDRNVLENIYRSDWLGRKIIDSVAEDCTREWRSWQANQDQIEALEEVEKTLDLQRKVKQWIIKARLYGGSALVIGVDDGNDPSQPIDLNKCGKDCLKYVVVLHRYELNAGPRLYNVSDPFYSRPAYYTIATPMYGFQGEAGSQYPDLPGAKRTTPPGALSGFWSNVVPFRGGRSEQQAARQQLATVPTNLGLTQIHPSRVLELPGNDLPDWRLAPLGGGWGDSVLQTVVDTMTGFTTVIQSIAAMVSDGKLDVVKIPDMALNLTTPGYKGKLIERFTLSAQTKSVISALLLDKEEEWNRISTNYAGLPMILHEFITIISGAANIPVTRLFGQASGRGLSGGSTGGSGESDLRNYYDDCASMQKNDIAPRLALLDEVLMRTALGKDDPNIHYEWNPLWVMSDEDKAKIALAKAQATQIYASLGIINEDVLRQGLVNQLIEDGTYPGLDDAIEEFGAEPEEPEDTGGYMPPTGGAPPQPDAPGGETAQPNMEQQHSEGAVAAAKDYDPDEPRDPHGEWTSGGGGGGNDQTFSLSYEYLKPGSGTMQNFKRIRAGSLENAAHQIMGESGASHVLIKSRSMGPDEPASQARPINQLFEMHPGAQAEAEKLHSDLTAAKEKETAAGIRSANTAAAKLSTADPASMTGKQIAKEASGLSGHLFSLQKAFSSQNLEHTAAWGMRPEFFNLHAGKPGIEAASAISARHGVLQAEARLRGGHLGSMTEKKFANKTRATKDYDPDEPREHASSAELSARVEDELHDIKALLQDAPRPPPPPINVNITMPPGNRVKKTVTTHRDDNGNLVAEVHEEDEE